MTNRAIDRLVSALSADEIMERAGKRNLGRLDHQRHKRRVLPV